MNAEAFVNLLQFSDGLLPVGSYAHSFGLESYAEAGTIQDVEGVEAFLVSYLEGSVAPTDVVAMLAARKAARGELLTSVERCLAIDHQLEAMKSASESREASRQMGRQILRIANNLGKPFTASGLIAHLAFSVENDETPGHHAMAFGVVGAALEWDEVDMSCAFLYSTCSSLIAASLRLLPIGQLAGQRALWNVAPLVAKLAHDVQGRDLTEIWSFAPAIEIAAMRHATLDARLFRS